MRKLSYVLMLISLMLLFLSLTGAQTNKITVWCSEKQVDILQRLGEEFKAKYGVSVDVQYVEFGSIKPNFLTAAPQGKGADVIVGAHDWVGELVVNGLLEPIAQFKDQNQFYTTALNAFSYGGKLYGLPYAMEAIALIYNKDYVKLPPSTFDALISTAKRIDTAYKGKVRGFITSGAEFYYVAPVLFGYGGYVFKETSKGLDVSDIGLANPGAIKGAKLWKRLFDEKILTPGDNYQIMDSMFKEGKAAMIINGPWAVKAYKDAGINYGVAVIPSLEKGVVAKPFVGVQGFMINAKSPNKILARDFVLNYIATKDTMYKIYLADPRIPARKDVLAMIKDNPDIVGFTKSAANGIPMPNVPEMAFVWSAMNDALNLIVNGKATPEEALENAVKAIKAQIKR
ncbi:MULTISPECIES: maltose ABC transporter substrate-binding protein [Dictyoglomus]|uniref:Extracellular solute-binding protein family 1 n=1 Tax=Dictyoglomus turgidum (strain DSM 6724 / Z-1310) TaxID=515635 RepID=B8E052_DICTD|nr:MULTISPECIES: maltose ABC transporter substrate-binding protein [Dictyoglomus]ACK42135.1 extracellular solute-binding protein family 1 [Dictyoglomus turgidum DSM 6724]HBU32366.1 maltose ABC transporter substrate-binding protein [Dictyoglomus sp.]